MTLNSFKQRLHSWQPQSWPRYARWIFYLFGLGLAGIVLAALGLSFALAVAWPRLPSIDALTDYRPKLPLRVFTADGVLIGEFGEERRSITRIEEFPDHLKQAILAAEDDNFYRHKGIDYVGITRAAFANLSAGSARQGASTITQQVARNFFLSSERTLTRKIYEMLLAFKIEANMSKDQILEVYMNQIFLGQRAYGFTQAAQAYYGKAVKDLSIAEAAMLAGLPKSPSGINPVSNPKRAAIRQQYVLRRMKELDFITAEQFAVAVKEPLKLRPRHSESQIHAEYVAEMARQIAVETWNDEAYTRGLNIYTTLISAHQNAAYAAVRRGILDYERRHGYRGPEAFVELPAKPDDDWLDSVVDKFPDSDNLLTAVVLEAQPKRVRVARPGERIEVGESGLKFVASALSANAQPARRLRPGAVVRITRNDKNEWEIIQVPQVETAFVAMSSLDGAVRALVGGFDFDRNKFNHVTQAWRQPGSSFKPFIYSAALEKGFTPSTMINDAPLFFDAAQTGGQPWEPKNYDGNFDGPMSMRTALTKSKNLVSVRILQSVGPQYAQDFVTRFGFDADKHPPYLTMALGAGSVTPWQMASAYSIFANGGYRVQPYFITKITDSQGRVLAQASPTLAGDESLRVLDERNVFLMDSIMKDVTRFGTAARAASLKRTDLAGKTGTTNDAVDAWFAGYNPALVAVAWVGYDQPKNLGPRETGGAAALPIWIGYMNKALSGVPNIQRPVPEGVVNLGGEFYYTENQPGQGITSLGGSEAPGESSKKAEEIKNELF
ncbi:MAG: penicillin-binding protein 1A [Burkholderiales bacterium]|jgi:penicillin-binding protein 1A|nr:penicillin-binding protein 1A [Burkholderiales bacterium]MCA3156862.1 penicillin-binding protein 1A [Burkholderiales bacterium]MCA3168405.1 penicillin-binding protein 1A [Burkholderiales bacterium]